MQRPRRGQVCGQARSLGLRVAFTFFVPCFIFVFTFFHTFFHLFSPSFHFFSPVVKENDRDTSLPAGLCLVFTFFHLLFTFSLPVCFNFNLSLSCIFLSVTCYSN